MRLLAIDPGSEESAYVVYDLTTRRPVTFNIVNNGQMLGVIATAGRDDLVKQCVCEDIESFGMPVGRSVFTTCKWMGQFELQWKMSLKHWTYITRSEVKIELCGSMKAKDSNIRQAIIDKYGETKKKAIGTKKAKGPLYGIKSHVWSALALAIVGSKITIRTGVTV